MFLNVQPLPTQHAKPLTAASFDPCGRRLATVSQDGMCQIYDTATSEGVPRAAFKAHDGPILSFAFGPLTFGRICATGSLDGWIRIWKEVPYSGTWQEVYADRTHKGPIHALKFSVSANAPPTAYQVTALAHNAPVGLHLASASQDGHLIVHSLLADNSWSRKETLAHSGGATAVDWSYSDPLQAPSSQLDANYNLAPTRKLVTAGLDGRVCVWSPDATTGGWLCEASLTGHHTGVLSVAWQPNSDSSKDLIASLGADGTIMLWMMDPSSKVWRQAQLLPLAAPGGDRLSWSLDGALLGVNPASEGESAPIFRETAEGEWRLTA